MTHPSTYARLATELKQIAILRSCASVLGWDEQTYLPHKGAEHRANQLALLAGLAHERATAKSLGDMLAQAETEAAHGSPVQRANVVESRRRYERATRIPQRLVEELSHTATLSQQAWVDATKKSDFASFRPWLEKMVGLKREEAAAVGYPQGGVPYDALLDEYEPGMSSAQVQHVFDELRPRVVQLVAAIRDSGQRPDTSCLTRKFPVPAQREFAVDAAKAIGFNFEAGRLDEAAHPFCSGMGPGDCRLTTRYHEEFFPAGLFGTLHEAGHGIYEQGLNPDDFGLPTGDAVSLGIHESQSRMWENFVGRGKPFWKHFYPLAQKRFSSALGDVSLDQFHAAINDVRPSWIRVESDEVTYNLHIMLRFDLERALIDGSLKVADVPEAWNAKFTSYFGMTPPEDRLGCLQDVHWSAGLIGYFATYALGNMYAAQFFEQARHDLGDLDAQFARGEFTPLREWLNKHIHQHGMRYRAPELVQVVTGRPLSSDPLLTHLWTRFGPLFGVEASS